MKKTATATYMYSHKTFLNSRLSNHKWESPRIIYKNPVKNKAIIVAVEGQNHKRTLTSRILNVSIMPQGISDLISLSRFPYMIRSISNFSQISDFIGEHKLVISPKQMAYYRDKKNKKHLVIETVTIKTRDENGIIHKRTEKNI